MKLYSKVLELSDYKNITNAIQYYKNIESKLGHLVRVQHPSRMWEYGTILKILEQTSYKTFIDIGGSGSALPQCFSTKGLDVTVIDFDDESKRIDEQNKLLKTNVKFIAEDFLNIPIIKYDVIACISTIEHVPDDNLFFDKLLDSCNENGLVYITCDFFTSHIHPNEPPTYKNWVNRTYTKDKLISMSELAKKKGFRLFNEKFDWEWRGPQVYNYNFASLILERVS